MTLWLRRGALGLSLAALFAMAGPQRGGGLGGGSADPFPPITLGQQDDVKLPNGKSQKDEILKAEHAQNIKDAAELADLVKQLQEDLEKTDYSVLSMSTLKKTDDIEKLVKKIRGRLRHN